MTRAVTIAELGDTNVFSVDGTNNRVGIGSTQPTVKLDVAGIVTATAFYGDGSNLEGVASAGLGTALSDTDGDANSVIYFTNTTLGIGSTVIIDPPSSSNVAYTQYQEVSLDADVDLIVAEGDDFVPDILGLEEGSMLFGANSGGSSSSGISNVAEDATPQLGGNLDLNSKNITGNGNININGTFTGDGSGLTNVSAVGTGIGVSNNGTNVGTAQTINFSTGITITTVSAGLATVTVDSTTFATSSGIATESVRAGIATQVDGFLGIGVTATGLSATGIITATGVRISGNAGIITATGHVDSGIVTYRGDSSYSAAGRWVLGASGSDHYTFTGPGLGHSTLNDPTLYLMRGQTYMFENKMGAHPFRIQSTSNGSTGTQWNVGVTNNDVSNGVLIFEVPFVCPNTLYYQCTSHANMGGVLNIVT
jgi:hypothetical protein